MTQTSSDWYVLATDAGYVGRYEQGVIIDVPLAAAAALATEEHAIQAQQYVRRVTGANVTVHAVDAAWIQHRFGTIPA